MYSLGTNISHLWKRKINPQHVVNPHSKVAMDGMGKGGDALECRFLHESLQEGGEVWVRVEVGDRYWEYMSLSLANMSLWGLPR